MKVLRQNQIKFEQLYSKDKSQMFSLSGVLSEVLTSEDFFIHIEKVSPGIATSLPHSHHDTEEVVFVLKGEITAVEGEERIKLSSGDSGLFKKSSRAHFLINESSTDAELIVITRKLSYSDVTF